MTQPVPTATPAAYSIHYLGLQAEISDDLASPIWDHTATVRIEQVRPRSSSHRPETVLQLGYTDQAIVGRFTVQDQYVRAVSTEHQAPVCKDSCVEFFVQPHGSGPYFNFEFSISGALLCYYIIDSRRPEGKFNDYKVLTHEECSKVNVQSSRPGITDPEITDPLRWQLRFSIPFSLLEAYSGPLGPIAGSTWRANFYKCADHSSHPHWLSWQPLTATDFHLPECFGPIQFT